MAPGTPRHSGWRIGEQSALVQPAAQGDLSKTQTALRIFKLTAVAVVAESLMVRTVAMMMVVMMMAVMMTMIMIMVVMMMMVKVLMIAGLEDLGLQGFGLIQCWACKMVNRVRGIDLGCFRFRMDTNTSSLGCFRFRMDTNSSSLRASKYLSNRLHVHHRSCRHPYRGTCRHISR